MSLRYALVGNHYHVSERCRKWWPCRKWTNGGSISILFGSRKIRPTPPMPALLIPTSFLVGSLPVGLRILGVKTILVSGYFLELDTAHSAAIPMEPRAVLPSNTCGAHQTFHGWFTPTHEAATVAPSVFLAFI
jgi:hypothetical protein